MKNTYTTFLFAISFFLFINQGHSQISNGGFETWITTGSYANPQYWDSPNTETTIIPIVGSAVLTKSSGAHSGSWCAKLETKNLILATVPGIMVTGQMTIDIAAQTAIITGGAPCSQQVPKITGYYKYSPVGGDTCGMVAVFTKHNNAGGTDTIGFAFYESNSSVSTWTPFEAEVYWTSIENPDTVRIIIGSSISLNNSVAGSVMYVDDLALDFSSGVSEPLMAEQSNIYYNPVTASVEVHLGLEKAADLNVRIYNISGQLLLANSYGSAPQFNTEISLGNLPDGMYFVELQAGKEIHTTKVVKQ